MNSLKNTIGSYWNNMRLSSIILLFLLSQAAIAQPTFSTRVDLNATFSGTTSTTAYDHENDGDLDIAVTSANDNSLSILINDGSQNFTKTLITSALTTAFEVKHIDTDNDGDMDLLAIGTNQVMFWRNDAGTYSNVQNITVSGGSSLAVGDLTGDNVPDLVVSSSSTSQVAWFTGAGNSFSSQTSLLSASAADVEIVDFDKDGDHDIVAAMGTELTLLTNSGTGSFTASTIYAAGAQTFAVADLDGDTDNDVLIGTGLNEVYTAINNGDGTYTATLVSTTPTITRHIAASDLDLDGDMDAVLASNNDATLFLYTNDGSGSFQESILSSGLTTVQKSELVDLNKDGKDDVVASVWGASAVSYFENTSSTIPTPRVSYSFSNSVQNDESPNTDDITIPGSGFSYAADRFLNPTAAAELDGTGRMTAAVNSGVGGIYSFSAWIYPRQFSSEIFHTVENYFDGLFFTLNGDGTLSLQNLYYDGSISDSYTLTTTTQINADQWTHIGFTFSGNDLTIYINGAVDATGTVSAFTAYPSSIDGLFFGDGYEGVIDDIKIYNETLSATNFNDLYSENNWPTSNPLVAYYNFEGGATDKSGNGYDATVVGATSSADRFGPLKTAYYFAPGDYIEGPSTGFPTGSTERTVSGWVRKSTNLNQGHILEYGDAATTAGKFGIGLVSGVAHFWGSNADLTGTSNLIDGKWHHVAATYDGSTVRLYVDGVEEASGVVALNTQAGTGVFRIGAGGLDNHEGDIDDVSVYSIALSASAIQELYSENNWPNSDPLAAQYDFTGDGSDASGNGNTATFGDGVTTTTFPVLTSDRFSSANSALSFDGSLQYLDLGSPAQLSLGGDITISAWVYWDGNTTSTNQTIISRAKDGELEADNIQYKLQIIPTGSLVLEWEYNNGVNVATDQSAFSISSIPVGEWTHVMVTRQDAAGAIATFYINGQVDNVVSGLSMPSGGTDIDQRVYIGRNNETGLEAYFDGFIDDVQIYNVALPATEAERIYGLGGWPVSTSTLIAQYIFSGDATDASGNANNLSAFGAPTLTSDRFGTVNEAYTLNGVDDYFTVSNIDAHAHVTLAGWFNTSHDFSSSYANFIDLAGAAGLGIGNNNNVSAALQLGADNWVEVGTPNQYNDGQWHHAAVTFDGTAMILYVDGSEVGRNESYSGDLSNYGTPTNLNLGYSNDGVDHFFTGAIDGIEYHSVALTAMEISDIVSAGGWVPPALSYRINNGDFTASTGTFTDSGGDGANYLDNENYTSTITSGIGGQGVSLTFTSFDLELDYDYLYIYDGPNKSYPLIGTFTGSGTAGGNVPTTVSATNVHGALTVEFISDAGVNNPGWVADISTVALALPSRVAEYRFNGDAVDQTGNGNDGTTVNVNQTNNRFGDFPAAYNFNGTNTYVAVADSWQMQLGTDNDFAISGWFRADAANGILFDKSDGFTGYLGWLQSDGTLLFYIVQDGVGALSLTTSTTWADGEWHHFVMQADRDASMAIYVDGILESINSTLSNGVNPDTSEDFLIGVAGETGNSNLNTYFNGDLDDFILFSRTLTDQQAFDLYDEGGWNASQLQVSDINFDGATYVDDFGSYDTATGFPVGTEPGFADDRFAFSSASLSLDGSTQYLTYSSSTFAGYDLEYEGTASVWVNPSTYGTGSTVLQFSDGSSKYLVEVTLDSQGFPTASVYDGLGASASVSSGAAVPLNTWTHLAVRYNFDFIALFVNGIYDNGADAFVDVLSSETASLVVGTDFVNGGNLFGGLVDDITLYSAQLSDSEIRALYNEGLWPAQLVTAVRMEGTDGTNNFTFDLTANNAQGFQLWGTVREFAGGESFNLAVDRSGSTYFFGDADGADDIADADAAPFTISEAGVYYVRFDASNRQFLIYKINTVTLVGSAITGDETGWNEDIALANQGGGNFVLTDVNLQAGEFKLRANSDWNVINWGDDNVSPDGFFELFGGNIPVAAGTYDLVAHFSDNTYTLTPALGQPTVYEIYPLSTSEIQLYWSDVANETGYRIYKTSVYPGGTYELVAEVGTDVTSYTVSGLPADDFGVYYIQAFNDAVNKNGPFVHPVATFSTNTQTKSQYFNLLGDANNDNASESWVDDSGYYIFGTYDNSITLGGVTYSSTGKGLYAVKYDHNHNFLWAQSLDSYNTTIASGHITVYGAVGSSDGSIYLTGLVAGDLNGSSSHQYTDETSTTVAQSNAYMLKLSASNGGVLGSRIFQSTGYSVGEDLEVDAAGNIYMAAQFRGDLNLAGVGYVDPGATLLKMDSGLNDLWVVHGSGSADGMGWGVAYDATNAMVYLTGRMYGTTDFSTTGSGVLTSNGDADFFLAKYDANGGFQWATNIGGTGFDLAWDVILDGSNNPYITGYFLSPSVSAGATTHTNTGSRDMLLIKFDSLGNVVWSSQASGSIREYAVSMATDGSNIYLTGYKDENVSDFSGLSVSNGEIFLASYANDGTINWVEVIEGDGFGEDVNVYNGSVFQVGNVRNRVNLAGNYYDTNSGSTDAFISIYNPNQLAPGLVGYYTFDGGSTADMSGNGYDGTAVNSPLFSMDRFGNFASGFEPQSNSTYIDIQNGNSWSFGGSFAISAWVRLNDFVDENEGFITVMVDGPGQFGLASTSEERSTLVYHWEETAGNFPEIHTNNTIERNQWTHVAMTVDSNNDLRMYIDGELQYITRDGSTYSTAINIGRNFDIVGGLTLNTAGGTRSFDGSIDDVRFYTGVDLTDQAVLDIFESELSGGYDRLVAEYDFLFGEMLDISGNSFNDGTYRDVNNNVITPLLDFGRDGDSDGALSFQNDGGHVKYFHERAINVNNNVTVNLWLYPYALPSSTEGIGDVVFSDDVGGRLMYDANGTLFYHYPSSNGVDYPSRTADRPTITVGEWQMITYTIDLNDNIRVYHNGQQVLNATIDDQMPNLSVFFSLGLNDLVDTSDTRYLNAIIDDVSIRQRVMSGEEIGQMFIENDYRLLAYYPFNGNAIDESGNGNDGQINGATLTVDRFGNNDQAFDFNGVDDYITLESDILGGLTETTISFWIDWNNPSDKTDIAIMDLGAIALPLGKRNVSDGFDQLVMTPNLSFGDETANRQAYYDVSVPESGWHYVTITFDGNSFNTYLDGQIAAEQTGVGLSSLPYTSSGITLVGGRGLGTLFEGLIDDIRIYDVALSSEEIKGIYDEENPGSTFIAHYTFDDGTPSDQTGNGNDGVAVNGATAGVDRFGTAGQAFQFDGVDDYVDMSPREESFSNGLTFMTWAYMDAANTWARFFDFSESGESNDNILFGRNDATNDLVYEVWHDGGVAGNLFASGALALNQWMHVAVTHDAAGNVTIYQNGVAIASGNISLPLDVVRSTAYLGRSNWAADATYSGLMDEVRLYSTALTGDEIASIYDAERPLPPAPASGVFGRVVGPTAAEVFWADNSDNETGFDVLVEEFGGTSGSFTYSLPANSTYFLIPDLITDVEYSITVIAKNAAGSSVDASSVTYVYPVQLPTPIVEVSPANFTLDDEITITYYPDRSYPEGELVGASPIYMHSGLVEPGNEYGEWSLAVGNWGADDGVGQMTSNGDGSWSITITPRTYYGLNSTFVATQLAMVFRNADGTLSGRNAYDPAINTTDIFIDLFSPDQIQKVPGAYAQFDGTNNLSLNLNTTAFTPAALSSQMQFSIESWVNLSALPGSGEDWYIYARTLNANTVQSLSIYNNGSEYTIDFGIGDGTNISWYSASIGDGTTFMNQWNHIAATFDGTVASIYLNGILVHTSTVTNTLATGVGSDDVVAAGVNMQGGIDDLRYWNYPLSVDDIRSRVSTEISGSTTGLNGYWTMNETLSDGVGAYTPDITVNDNRLYGDVTQDVPDMTVSIDFVNGVVSSGTPEMYINQASTIDYTVYNQSTANVTIDRSIGTAFYLSSNAIFDGFDRYIGRDDQAINLSQGTSATYTASVTIPADMAARSYYLIAVGDVDEVLDEAFEDNNRDVSVITVVDIPPLDPPSGLSSSNVTTSSFTFSWSAPSTSGVSGFYYQYQLSDASDFSNVIASNSNHTSTSIDFTGYDSETTYFFRVRAGSNDDSRISDYVDASVTTSGDTDNPVITSIQSDVSKTDGTSSVGITVTVSDAGGVDYVELYKKPALGSTYTQVILGASNTTDGSNYTSSVEPSDFDSEGVTLYAIAYDLAGNVSEESDRITIIKDISTAEVQTIPSIITGTEVTDYQMIAFPYESKSVTEVLNLGAKDPSIWRVLNWGGSSYTEPNSFVAGNGYWLIINDPTINSISFDGASKTAVSGESFSMSLRNGWTQIGNPFLEVVDWASVLDYNELKGNFSRTDISQVYIFQSGNYTTTNSLTVYQGAFVKNDGPSTTLEIPYSALPSSGRFTQETAQPRDYLLSESDWEMVMEISSNGLYTYGVAGFGENTLSVDGADKLDMSTPIMFDKFINITMDGTTLDGEAVARSIKEPATNNVWVATVTSHFDKGTIMDLNFNGFADLDAGESLVLFDMQTGKMHEISGDLNYSFAYQDNYKLKIIKGTDSFIEEHAFVDNMVVSELYPNPSDGLFRFDMLLPKISGEAKVSIQVSDISGKHIVDQVLPIYDKGSTSVELDMRSMGLNSGLYIFKIQLFDENSHVLGNKITKKGYLISR